MEEIFTKLCELVNVDKENEESAKKDYLSGADLLMAAKLKQQQETSNL
jgi:hypothetical protein